MHHHLCFSILLVLLTSSVTANSASPYTGEETRDIKSLSEKEIDDYLAGHGMGLAKAAELNHYPGPRHVLDAAETLALTADQRTRSQEIFSRMQTQATRLGAAIVSKERTLDRSFAGGSITDAQLRQMLNEIAQLQSELRYVHLQAHLAQRAVLTSHQLAQYDTLRGYAGTMNHNDHSH